MEILDIVHNKGFKDLKKQAERKYTTEEYKKFENSIENIKNYDTADFAVNIYKYIAQKTGKIMYCIEFYATWLPDVEDYFSIITNEEPKIENIENIINNLKTVKIGDKK